MRRTLVVLPLLALAFLSLAPLQAPEGEAFAAPAAAPTASSTGVPSSAGVSPDGGASRAPRGVVTPPAIDDVEQMCALLTSCPDLPIPSSMLPHDFATCVRTMSQSLASPAAVNFSLTLRECGLGANSCAGLRACALRGARPETCSGRGRASTAGFCDADGRAVSCWHEHILAVRDCPRGGEQCSVREGEATCSLGPCPADMQEGAPPVCSASGTRILKCEKGRLASLDCGAFGLKCVDLPSGPACATAEKPCVEGAKRCDGTTAVGCYNGREVRVDCAAAGLACGGTGTPIGACTAPSAAPGADVHPCGDAAPHCDGASIAYCSAGRSRSYFCKSMGFARCLSDRRGVRCAN